MVPTDYGLGLVRSDMLPGRPSEPLKQFIKVFLRAFGQNDLIGTSAAL